MAVNGRRLELPRAAREDSQAERLQPDARTADKRAWRERVLGAYSVTAIAVQHSKCITACAFRSLSPAMSLLPPCVRCYQEPIPHLNLAALGVVSNTVPDGSQKVFIGGLPYDLTAEQVGHVLMLCLMHRVARCCRRGDGLMGAWL